MKHVKIILLTFVICVILAIFTSPCHHDKKVEQDLPPAQTESTPEPGPLTPADLGLTPADFGSGDNSFMGRRAEDINAELGSMSSARASGADQSMTAPRPTMNSEPALTEWGRVESSVHK